MQPNHHELRLGLERRLHDPGVGGSSSAAQKFYESETDTQSAVQSILGLRRGPVRYPRNKVICLEGDPAEHIFLVAAGVLRTCRTFQDGHRTVVCFHVSGEFDGSFDEPRHSFCAEAATNCAVLLIKRSSVRALAARDSRVANFLFAEATRELRRSQEHAILITRRAQCRVAKFLIDLSVRLGTPQRLDLPMSHQDIADFLGLTIETLSRVITEFERAGFISRAPWRSLIFRDLASFKRLTT